MRDIGLLMNFREVRNKLHHKLNRVNIGYLSTLHLLTALCFVPIIYAPDGLLKAMGVYFVVHVVFALTSTTAYAHRLISHGATRRVNLLVHLFFGYLGQTLAAQGSLASWAGKHRVHHAVDGNGHHDEDPYSAVWFTSAWRNFLWSHVLCYCFESPHEDALFKKRTESVLKQHHVMRLQHDHYLTFLIALTKLTPFLIGLFIGGSFWSGLCFLWTSLVAIVVSQHITWSVNSVTHMWGERAARSSAKNNYVWLLPLGEGNHHADHHDAPTDYRNGFGLTGWLLDPTRYVILLLRAMRLVGPLQRASRSAELKMIAERRLKKLSDKKEVFYLRMCKKISQSSSHHNQLYYSERLGLARQKMIELWESYDESLADLKTNLCDRAQRLDQLKKEKAQLLAQRSQYTKDQLDILLKELKAQLKLAKRELQSEWRIFTAEIKAARIRLGAQVIIA